MNVYFHLFRKNRGQTRCDLWFTKWEANTRNAVCHLLMQKPVELDWRFSKALPLGTYKGNSCFIFILLLWPDSSSVWRVSCNEAVKFVSKCLRFTENKRFFTVYISARDSNTEMILLSTANWYMKLLSKMDKAKKASGFPSSPLPFVSVHMKGSWECQRKWSRC